MNEKLEIVDTLRGEHFVVHFTVKAPLGDPVLLPEGRFRAKRLLLPRGNHKVYALVPYRLVEDFAFKGLLPPEATPREVVGAVAEAEWEAGAYLPSAVRALKRGVAPGEVVLLRAKRPYSWAPSIEGWLGRTAKGVWVLAQTRNLVKEEEE